MKKVKLIRLEQDDKSTLGSLLIDGRAICWTLEEPWRDNLTDISCIPEGRYLLELEYSPSKQRNLWTVKEVPCRSYIRIHTGNTVKDTEGCVLLGNRPGALDGMRAVHESRAAFRNFMDSMGGQLGAIAELEVRKVCAGQ